MKAIKILILFFVIHSSMWIAPQKAAGQVSVSFQVFYDELSPHGTWVNNPDYGYVWYPNLSSGFTPYGSNGYWVLTHHGWTWVSDYSWGWAPFHYGRWYHDPFYGPMWVPGNEWGPGWVTWRSSGGYYGWAPIGPGVSISIAYSSGYYVPHNQWVFVSGNDFGRTNISNYYVNSSNNVTIINNSTVINNTRGSQNGKYNAGPDKSEVEKQSGKKFTPVSIKESGKPGQEMNQNQLEIYKPQVQKNNSSGAKPAPAKVGNIKDVKPAGQKGAGTSPQKTNQPGQQQHQQKDQRNQPGQNQDKPINPSKKQEDEKPTPQAKPSPNPGGQKQQSPPPQQKQTQPKSNPAPKQGGETKPQQSNPPVQQRPAQKQPDKPVQKPGGENRPH